MVSKQEQRRRRREEERRREARKPVNRIKAHPKIVTVAVGLAVLVLIAFLAPRPMADPVACGTMGLEAQHIHFYVYVQVGEGPPNSKSIRIHDDMGVKQSCVFPVHVHEGSGSRGYYFTLIHVEAFVADHRYTLGDFFSVWGRWLVSTGVPANGTDGSLYFGPDGVSHVPSNAPTYRGTTEVRTATGVDMFDTMGPWNDAYGWASQPASREIVLQDGVFYHVWVRGTF